MSEERSQTMGALWFFCALVLIALFISAAVQNALTTGHIVLACLILAVAGTLYFIFLDRDESAQEKAKRQQIDDLLNNLTDDQLAELNQRLMAVDGRLSAIDDYMDDDGELTLRR